MNPHDYTIRPEEQRDHRAVENLVREAFWNVYRPGYGKALLDYSLERAAALGYGAVLFEGNIAFYGKSGFDYARHFGIRYHDLPADADDSFFLCKELIPGYLDSVTGVYRTPPGYYVSDEDVQRFDREFPRKEKLRLPGQIF